VQPTVADTGGESSIRLPQADTILGAEFGEGISSGDEKESQHRHNPT